MLGKISAIWRVFRAGEVVANPTAWKLGQIGTNAVAGLLIAISQASESFGYEIPITGEGIDALAAGIVVLGNVIFTIITTDKVGVLPRNPADNAQQ